MRRPGLAVAAAVLAAVLVVGVWLSDPLTREAPRLLASNQIDNFGGIVELKPGERICQDSEQIPRDAGRIVAFVGIPSGVGGPVEVTATEGADRRPVFRARTGPISTSGPAAARLPGYRETANATICFQNRGSRAISLGGEFAGRLGDRSGGSVPTVAFPSMLTKASGVGVQIQGRVRIEYPVDGGPQSPLDMAGHVAERSGLWHGKIGGPAWMWIALGMSLLAGALAVLAAVRLPRRALAICAVVGFLNAAAWTLITPQFQVPDEAAHFGYVQYLAETGLLPESLQATAPPPDLSIAAGSVPFSTIQQPGWVGAHERAVERELEEVTDSVDRAGAGYVANNPPLYYLTQVVPYHASAWGTVYDRMTVLRLVNALLVALLAALVFAFLRELAPRSPRMAVTGALAAALHPMVGFLGGGVTPDIFFACEIAAFLWLMTRMFRRGPELWTGLAAGAALGAALLTKPAALTVIPGALLLGVALIGTRPRAQRRHAFKVASASAAVVAGLFLFWNWADAALWNRDITATAGFSSTQTRGGALNLREGISYLWQFYLPPLSFMEDQWPHEVPLWRTWFQGFVGRFGWHQFGFPMSVNWAALGLTGVAGVLAGRGLWVSRATARAKAPLLLALVGAMVAMAGVVHAAGYRYRRDVGFEFEQVRYLFPLLIPLYGAFVAVAVRGAGRFAAPAAAFLLTLLAGHDLAAQLLTLQRYYL